jgi:hypothetical protein
MSMQLQKLLDGVQQRTQIDISTLMPPGKMSAADLAQHELFEIVRWGYWPVSLLRQQQHWLCEGETLDDSGSTGFVEHDNDIAGYEFRCWIGDHVAIHLAVFQGNVVEIDGHNTVLRFDCYDLDTGNEIAMQQYEITQFAQIDAILNANWQQFIEQIWPAVVETYNKHLDYYTTRCEDEDSEIHLEFTKWAWHRFNPRLREQLERLEFADWWASDVVKNWLKS